ncbi:IS3 family transposase [Pandoraea sputorum]|uniref:IS3 family transposase n=1 Tax=Pandoraea sputorum TaxID=93222 RepID=UPI001CD33EA7|nr:IS3 family transposase [Pandoraea sputorum]
MRHKGIVPITPQSSRFWGTLNTERVYNGRFATRAQGQQAITEYIELFHNRQRAQARLDYLSPAAYTARYCSDKIPAWHFPVRWHTRIPTDLMVTHEPYFQ